MSHSLRILVTAGPTREAIDPVRFISNPSTGRMGYAVAAAAVGHGHDVRLVTGPVALDTPDGVDPIRVTTARQMLEAVRRHLAWCNALVMAAAVCDWRPAVAAEHKLKKTEMPDSLPLERTPDILREVADLKADRIYVGFAAETRDLESEGRRKLQEKNLDMIVANRVGVEDSGFGAETNSAMIVTAGAVERLPLMKKNELAARIIEWIEGRRESRDA